MKKFKQKNETSEYVIKKLKHFFKQSNQTLHPHKKKMKPCVFKMCHDSCSFKVVKCEMTSSEH